MKRNWLKIFKWESEIIILKMINHKILKTDGKWQKPMFYVKFELDSLPKSKHRFTGTSLARKFLEIFFCSLQQFLTPLTFSCHIYHLTRFLFCFTAHVVTSIVMKPIDYIFQKKKKTHDILICNVNFFSRLGL